MKGHKMANSPSQKETSDHRVEKTSTETAGESAAPTARQDCYACAVERQPGCPELHCTAQGTLTEGGRIAESGAQPV